MKKIYFLLAVLGFLSCSDDDSPPVVPVPADSIYGKWYYKETNINGTVIPYNDHEPCGKDYIEFYDVNKVKSIDVWDCEEEIDWMATFIKTGNIITINDGEISRDVEIIELSQNILRYKYEYDGDEDGDEETYIETFDR